MKKSTFFIFIISVLLINNAWSQDTIVQQAGPEGKYANLWSYHPYNNYGHTSLFHTMGWTFWGEQGIIRSLIGFDLSVIPPSAVILNARLSLYYLNTQPDPNIQPGENESYLQLITSDWDEEAVTWNNPPSTTSMDEVYLPQSTGPGQDYPDIDVTIPISKMFNEPESYFGLMLRLKNEDPYACMLFASGDCEITELRPKLEIIYLLCDPPTADFDYQVDGDSVSFLGISPTATSWHWDFGDGYYSNLENPWHQYAELDDYLVCLITWNECGSDTLCQMLFLYSVYIPEENACNLLIYPNPVRDQIYIKSTVTGQAALSLLDLSGKEVLQQNMDVMADETIKIPLDQIGPGLYIIRFKSGKNEAFSKIVVVK